MRDWLAVVVLAALLAWQLALAVAGNPVTWLLVLLWGAWWLAKKMTEGARE